MESRVVPFGSSQCHTITGEIEIVIDRQSRKVETRQTIALRGKVLQDHRVDQRRPQVLMSLFRDIGLLSAVDVARGGCFEPLTARNILAGFSARGVGCAALPSLDTGFGHFQPFAHQGCASAGNARFFHRVEDVAALLHIIEKVVAEEAAASEDCDVEHYHAGAECVCGVVPPVFLYRQAISLLLRGIARLTKCGSNGGWCKTRK
jgi:hypothetical protein